MFEVLISRTDAHKLQLNNMDTNGNHVVDNIRYWITPYLEDGVAYIALVQDNSYMLAPFFSIL